MSLQEFRDNRARAKRADILDAASRLFSERGFRDVSTATLAAQAGVSTATLYRYFEDKEALFAAVVDALVADVIQAVANQPASLEDKLHDLALRYALLLSDTVVVGLIRAVVSDSQSSSGFRDQLALHGSEIFADEFDSEITDLLTEQNPAEAANALQASIELRGALEHVTLLPELLFNEYLPRDELESAVERTLASWRRRWLEDTGLE